MNVDSLTVNFIGKGLFSQKRHTFVRLGSIQSVYVIHFLKLRHMDCELWLANEEI